jgi:hypothetical protein
VHSFGFYVIQDGTFEFAAAAAAANIFGHGPGILCPVGGRGVARPRAKMVRRLAAWPALTQNIRSRANKQLGQVPQGLAKNQRKINSRTKDSSHGCNAHMHPKIPRPTGRRTWNFGIHIHAAVAQVLM